MKYNCLYVDVPWGYDNQKTGGSFQSGAKSKYKVMTTQEVCDMAPDIKSISDKDSVLFMWGTVPMLPEALLVIEAWGFKYKTKITWHKIGRLGLGYWFRGEVEELFVATRGSFKALRCQERNHIEHPVLKHSEKPEVFRQLIDKAVSNIKGVRKIELFSRNVVPGWTCIGDHVDGKDIHVRLKEIAEDALS